MAFQRAVTGEPVLQHVTPEMTPPGLLAERGQGHPQVTGRQDTELLPKPAGGPAVVGDGHHGGHVLGDMAKSPKRRRQPVPTTEGGHPQRLAAHSRPRSR